MHSYTFYIPHSACGSVMFRHLARLVMVLSVCTMGNMPLEWGGEGRAKTIFLLLLTPLICYKVEMTKAIVRLCVTSSLHWGLTASDGAPERHSYLWLRSSLGKCGYVPSCY